MNNHILQMLQIIMTRSSIRAYTDEKLTKDETDILKKAVLSAPTAKNRQEQKFFFITSSEMLNRIDQNCVALYAEKAEAAYISSCGNTVLYHAPLFVVIASNIANRYAQVDGGIAVQTLAIVAKAIGLDSVILGWPFVAFTGDAGEILKAELGFPQGYEYIIGIAIGHGAVQKTPHKAKPSNIINI